MTNLSNDGFGLPTIREEDFKSDCYSGLQFLSKFIVDGFSSHEVKVAQSKGSAEIRNRTQLHHRKHAKSRTD